MTDKRLKITLLLLLALAAGLFPLWLKEREEWRQAVARKCLGHLKVLSVSMAVYKSNTGTDPLDGIASFSNLSRRLMRSGVVAPGDRDFLRCCEQYGYILFEPQPKKAKGGRWRPRPIMRCPAGNEHGDVNVLFNDSHIEYAQQAEAFVEE